MDTEKYLEMLDGKIDNLNERVQNLSEVLNNGVKKQTAENTEVIEELSDEVTELKMKIEKDNSFESGKIKMIVIIVATISILGNSVLGILTIFDLVGVL